ARGVPPLARARAHPRRDPARGGGAGGPAGACDRRRGARSRRPDRDARGGDLLEPRATAPGGRPAGALPGPAGGRGAPPGRRPERLIPPAGRGYPGADPIPAKGPHATTLELARAAASAADAKKAKDIVVLDMRDL